MDRGADLFLTRRGRGVRSVGRSFCSGRLAGWPDDSSVLAQPALDARPPGAFAPDASPVDGTGGGRTGHRGALAARSGLEPPMDTVGQAASSGKADRHQTQLGANGTN